MPMAPPTLDSIHISLGTQKRTTATEHVSIRVKRVETTVPMIPTKSCHLSRKHRLWKKRKPRTQTTCLKQSRFYESLFRPGPAWPHAFISFTHGHPAYTRQFSPFLGTGALIPHVSYWRRKSTLLVAGYMIRGPRKYKSEVAKGCMEATSSG